jgi:enoyl-CoA hydratase/carnithine racemase
VVIRGAGTKAFAPGNDISEFATERSNVEQARAYGEDMRRTIDAIGSCRHPVVAQIHGICVGGGLEIAGLCDIRICGESSRFGVPINKLGLVMAYAEIGRSSRCRSEAAPRVLLEGRIRRAEADSLSPRGARRRGRRGGAATAQRIADGAPLVARWHRFASGSMTAPLAAEATRLRLLRHRGLARLSAFLAKEARVQGPMSEVRIAGRDSRHAVSSWRRSWPAPPAA